MALELRPLQEISVAIRRSFAEHALNHAFRLVAWLVDDCRRAGEEAVAKAVAIEPEPTGDHRWDAMLAGVAEYVCNLAEIQVPDWARRPERYLDRPWFLIEDLIGRPAPGLAACTLKDSPAELASRSVYIDAASFVSVRTAIEAISPL